jgi:hypothetical protein
MISLEQYWMGRDRKYAAQLTPEIPGNAGILIERVNNVLVRAAADDILPGLDRNTGTPVASGWRPKNVIDATANAGRTSKHIIGCAIDLWDTLPDRALARWCLRNRRLLEESGLWMEDPQWTPSWVHLQSLPPGSGNRVFIPSTLPALAAMLPEQRGI